MLLSFRHILDDTLEPCIFEISPFLFQKKRRKKKQKEYEKIFLYSILYVKTKIEIQNQHGIVVLVVVVGGGGGANTSYILFLLLRNKNDFFFSSYLTRFEATACFKFITQYNDVLE